MRRQSFSLQPFNSELNINISGEIIRNQGDLSIKYTLTGNLTELVITEPKSQATRQHELWQTTCFEFFLAMPDSPQYWEFNLSLDGDWNIYHFASYRQGMKEETAFTSLPFRINQDAESLNLYLELALSEIISENQKIEVAIATVTESRNSEINYWALKHLSKEADFHHRDSFEIAI
ncbi:MAG: DOMON-like domain-containing protein [Spirulinaceae cyanobacterium]